MLALLKKQTFNHWVISSFGSEIYTIFDFIKKNERNDPHCTEKFSSKNLFNFFLYLKTSSSLNNLNIFLLSIEVLIPNIIRSPYCDDTLLLRIRVLIMPLLLKRMTYIERSRKLLHIILRKQSIRRAHEPTDSSQDVFWRMHEASEDYHCTPFYWILVQLSYDRLSLTLSSLSIICMVAKDISFQNSLRTFSWLK